MKRINTFFIAASISFAVILIMSINTVSAEPIGWEEDVRLTNDPSGSHEPEIEADLFNNVHVVWTDLRDGVAEVYYKKYDGNGWSDDLRLDNDENGHSMNPVIADDSQNNLHVVFADNRRADNLDEIYYTLNDGSGWNLPERITINANLKGIIDYGPKLVVDSLDNIHVFWTAYRNIVSNNRGIYYIVNDGEGWSDIMEVTDASEDHRDLSATVDSNNNIHLVYETLTSGQGAFADYKRFDGNSWGEEIRISDLNGVFPSITSDSYDNLHVLWTIPTNPSEITYAKLDNMGTEIINDKRMSFNEYSSGHVKCETDIEDNIHFVWTNRDDDDHSNDAISYMKINSDGEILINETFLSYTATVIVGNVDEYPDLTIDSIQRIHVVWGDDRDGNTEIYYKSTLYYDLGIFPSDIQFSNELPENNEIISVSATIHNNGGYLTNATVYFYQDTINTANLIGSDFVQVPASGTGLASVTWDSVTGTHDIWVKIESEDGIVETNLTNNIASKEILVNDPPSIAIIAPPSGIVTVDDSYMISWVGNDPDDEADINLYYDEDNTGYDGTLIITSDQYPSGIVDNNGVSQTYEWDTSDLTDDSSFYIYAKIDDGLHAPMYSYSPGKIKIDHQNIAPTVEISSPSGGTHSGIVNIQGIASDDVSVLAVEIQIDSKGWTEATGTTSWSYEWYTTSYTNGEHTIRARAKDDSGLYSEEDSVTVLVDNGGNIVPSIEIKSHSEDEVVSGIEQIEGTAQDHDGNVVLVEIRIDNGIWNSATGTSSWTYSWDTTSYSNGEHVIYVRAKDNSQEYSQVESLTLLVSNGGNIPPIVTIISPSGGTVSGTISIRGSASDLDGDGTITSVEVKIDGDWETANGITEWSYNWDTTILDDGNYTISVRAFDGIDYSKEKSVEVSVDNPHTPTLTITSNVPDEASGTVTIRGTASDIDGEIIKIEIQVDEGEWKEAMGTTSWSYDLDTTKLSDGEHTINIRVYDDEGEYYEESFAISVNNSNFIIWLVIIIVIIILIASIISMVVIKKKRGKTATEPSTQQPIVQTGIQSLRCPQCNNVFEVSGNTPTIQCPYCGMSGTMK